MEQMENSHEPEEGQRVLFQFYLQYIVLYCNSKHTVDGWFSMYCVIVLCTVLPVVSVLWGMGGMEDLIPDLCCLVKS